MARDRFLRMSAAFVTCVAVAAAGSAHGAGLIGITGSAGDIVSLGEDEIVIGGRKIKIDCGREEELREALRKDRERLDGILSQREMRYIRTIVKELRIAGYGEMRKELENGWPEVGKMQEKLVRLKAQRDAIMGEAGAQLIDSPNGPAYDESDPILERVRRALDKRADAIADLEADIRQYTQTLLQMGYQVSLIEYDILTALPMPHTRPSLPADLHKTMKEIMTNQGFPSKMRQWCASFEPIGPLTLEMFEIEDAACNGNRCQFLPRIINRIIPVPARQISDEEKKPAVPWRVQPVWPGRRPPLDPFAPQTPVPLNPPTDAEKAGFRGA